MVLKIISQPGNVFFRAFYALVFFVHFSIMEPYLVERIVVDAQFLKRMMLLQRQTMFHKGLLCREIKLIRRSKYEDHVRWWIYYKPDRWERLRSYELCRFYLTE